MQRVLIIEDNKDLAFGLRSNLEMEGYEVRAVGTGPEGLRQAEVFAPDLVVLDLMLPQMDGFEVLEAMREGGLTMPVLILSARGEEVDKVRGLRLGADDYMTKPFGLMELLARVEAILRRGEPQGSANRGCRSTRRDPHPAHRRSARKRAACKRAASRSNSHRANSTCYWNSFATMARSCRGSI